MFAYHYQSNENRFSITYSKNSFIVSNNTWGLKKVEVDQGAVTSFVLFASLLFGGGGQHSKGVLMEEEKNI